MILILHEQLMHMDVGYSNYHAPPPPPPIKPAVQTVQHTCQSFTQWWKSNVLRGLDNRYFKEN